MDYFMVYFKGCQWILKLFVASKKGKKKTTELGRESVQKEFHGEN
jgi:hypothetical protein